jgi:hypothetical protein
VSKSDDNSSESDDLSLREEGFIVDDYLSDSEIELIDGTISKHKF